ncbi:hypothetical protein H920_00977 [Fukomys damarensis]|uniref:Uncharacterized protein n=1 Tax=Fukomys damarensis TaxID=885580 RepID=A0A091E4U4_FUKDA|nr:hypothetical protein H920_00977 [Fukomys damarensis]
MVVSHEPMLGRRGLQSTARLLREFDPDWMHGPVSLSIYYGHISHGWLHSFAYYPQLAGQWGAGKPGPMSVLLTVVVLEPIECLGNSVAETELCVHPGGEGHLNAELSRMDHHPRWKSVLDFSKSKSVTEYSEDWHSPNCPSLPCFMISLY